MSYAMRGLADDPEGRLGIVLLLNCLSDGASLGALAARLAGSISDLEPASRMLIAQRLVAYTSDLLVRPLSATAGRILDDANARLARLESPGLPAAANDC